MSLSVWLEAETDVGGSEPHLVELFSAYVTHNLSHMAEEAGIYKHLWRPDEAGVTQASQLIEPLETGLALLKNDPARFQKLNPANGWGIYEDFVSWVEEYLTACKKYPKSTILVSR